MPLVQDIRRALADVPPGRWLVGVSGGADSVALLRGVHVHRNDVEPIVVHLDHETRGDASTADAAFVAELSTTLDVACVVERISALGPVDEPNDEARFRVARHRLFARVAAERDALGVLLAHHADDRAETTLLRLLRGVEPTAIEGLRRESNVGDVRIVRPLLSLRRASLEGFLHAIGQPWREDSTNANDRYARNRARAFLTAHPTLTPRLLTLADAAGAWSEWVGARAPQLGDSFACAELADAPAPLARRAARRWLSDRGAPGNDLAADVVERLIAMASDGATASRQTFPGRVVVRRTRGRMS